MSAATWAIERIDQSMAQATTNQGVMQIYGLDTTASAVDVEKVAQAGVADNLTSLLTVLKSFQSK